MPQLQGLIFDLDGTLLDSAPDLRQAVNLLLGDYGRRPLELEEVKRLTGDGFLTLVQRAFEATGSLPATDIFPFVKKLISYYHAVTPDPAQIFPHVVPFLKKHFEAGVKLGVCTNKPQESSYALLRQLDLEKYFEFIAGGDTFPVHKPNPEHVYGVITALDVPREGCVFVGDGPNDIRAAHGAKIPCIVVTHGYGMDETVTQGADAVIAGFERLDEALAALGYPL